MGKRLDIKPGDKFHFLTIVEEVESANKKRMFRVRCVCGKEKIIGLQNMRNGGTTSCGCKKKEHTTKHGFSRTRIYRIWENMRLRCDEQYKCGAWYKYGARGIRVCQEWDNLENGFLNFYKWSMENGYADGLTIDRLDPRQGYNPSNCRWATYTEQNCHLNMLKNNKSGYVGISWSKTQRKWLATASVNNKTKRIGAYDTQKEAVEARNKFIDDNGLLNQKNEYKGELSQGY